MECDEILKDHQEPQDVLGKEGLFRQLQKRLLEKALGAESTDHLGCPGHEAIGRNSGNSREVFPTQESLLKLNYLGLERIAKKWTIPIHKWCAALNRFAIELGDRMPKLD